MKKVYKLIKWFWYITPGIIFVYAVNVELAGNQTIPSEGLWQILLAGFLTALVTVFFSCRTEGNIPSFVNILLHYAAMGIVMIGCGCWFGWMDFDAAGIVMMLVSVAVVYLLVFFIYYRMDVKQAEEINRKLKEKYGDRE